MTIGSLRTRLRGELESPARMRRFGTGWISGVLALGLSLACLGLTLTLRYPWLLAMPELAPLRGFYRPALQAMLLASYALALLSLLLRSRRVLGFTALALTIGASLLGGAGVEAAATRDAPTFLGLDYFILNMLFAGFLFVPIERFFAQNPAQPLFRDEWREDLFYFLVSSMLVQVLTFLSLAPSKAVVAATAWEGFRAAVGGQPWLLQLAEIMVLTDLVQYWVHRAFHRVPFLWRFHAIHHSATSMDWLAGSRLHLAEIVIVRGLTAIPMFTLGFEPSAIQAYVLIVYVYASYIHANVRSGWAGVDAVFATPRFHHWHHAADAEAVDKNFAIHFPSIDRLFGTHHLPKDAWPASYGIAGHPVPRGYFRQLLHPFRTPPRG